LRLVISLLCVHLRDSLLSPCSLSVDVISWVDSSPAIPACSILAIGVHRGALFSCTTWAPPWKPKGLHRRPAWDVPRGRFGRPTGRRGSRHRIGHHRHPTTFAGPFTLVVRARVSSASGRGGACQGVRSVPWGILLDLQVGNRDRRPPPTKPRRHRFTTVPRVTRGTAPGRCPPQGRSHLWPRGGFRTGRAQNGGRIWLVMDDHCGRPRTPSCQRIRLGS